MTHRRPIVRLIGLLIGLFALVVSASGASAHATLGSSDPPANEIISQSPGKIELKFTEAVEQTYTKIILVDQSNQPVAGTSLTFDIADDTIVRLKIPDQLPRGTYSVVWRTLSAADGHRFSGYFAFTIGSSSDVRTVIPPQFTEAGSAPFWLSGVSRWLSFLGLALLSGLWFSWLLIIRPALTPVWQIGPDVTRRIKRYAFLAGIFYLLATVLALVVQASGQSDQGWASALSDTVTETRWGRFWTIRLVIGGLITLTFLIAAWWRPRRRLSVTALLLLMAAALPFPHAMVSHASAQQYSRSEAIAFDYLHLVSISVWAGGLALLLITITSARDLMPGGRRVLLARALPRFSWMALTAFLVLGLTGFYSGYLQIGTWSALTDTHYGRQLLYKLIVFAVVLIVAACNLIFVSRRIGAMTDDSANSWWRRFVGLVTLEILGAVLILFFAGRLTALEPSRAVLAARANQQDIAFQLKDRKATLSIAPGSSGPNHFRLEVQGDPLGSDVTAALLLKPPVDMAGDKAVPLERTTGNAWEAHSAAMSVAGDWTITVTVSKVGAFQWSSDLSYPAPERTANVSTIGVPSWVIGSTALLGFLVGIAGMFGIGWGARASTRSAKREGFGLGGVAVLVAVVLILQGRSTVASSGIPLDTPNPVPVTDQAIEVGQAAFIANCAACHGVGGAGDGPAGINLNPPPANLLLGHAIYHYDAEFFNWIRNGKPGTAMPAFSGALTDEQIWSTILYVRSLQQDYANSLASPTAAPPGTPTSVP